MHLGNVMSALVAWLAVRSRGGRIILRIEDLDPQRSRERYARLIEEDLLWLGLDWDEGGYDAAGANAPYRQSLRHDLYKAALDRLRRGGLTYQCRCTRAELHASSAPHASDGTPVYGGTCRPAAMPRPYSPDYFLSPATERLYVPDTEIAVDDLIQGRYSQRLARDCGDFALRRADGAWAYQLAVVVDDASMGVTQVVRGYDLLASTPRQIYLYRLLELPVPQFAHIPLLCNASGQRLAKRDRSLSMEELRRLHTPAEITGVIAHALGLRPTAEPCTPASLACGFDLSEVTPAKSVIL